MTTSPAPIAVTTQDSFLSEAETTAVIVATLTGHAPLPVPESDIFRAVAWASGARAEQGALDGIVAGSIVIVGFDPSGEPLLAAREVAS